MHMHLWQALLLGLIQGVSELFPVSSLAQTILLPALFHWNFQLKDFLAFVVALHLATAIALLIYFWTDWRTVIAGFANSLRHKTLIHDKDSKFAWLLVAGTVVVAIVGKIAEKPVSNLFDKPEYAWIVAVILIVNGGVMFGADIIKRRVAEREQGSVDPSDPATDPPIERKSVEQLSLLQGTAVGAAQTLALLPGISRSGVTIVGGLLAGLSYEEASRFSFMLATPVIGLAALAKAKALLAPEARPMLATTVLSSVVAGVTAYLSVRFLMRYFKHHRLSPFAIYCISVGVISLFFLFPHS